MIREKTRKPFTPQCLCVSTLVLSACVQTSACPWIRQRVSDMSYQVVVCCPAALTLALCHSRIIWSFKAPELQVKLYFLRSDIKNPSGIEAAVFK